MERRKIVGFILMIVTWFPGIVQADGLNFNVKTQIPENQVNKNVTYFDLKIEPGRQQNLFVELTNSSNKAITVSAKVKATTTNSLGVLEYGESLTTLDDTAPFNIEKLVTLPEPEVTIPANQKKNFVIQVKQPPKSYAGILLGGVTYSEKQQSAEKEKSAVGITNKFVFTHALVLHGEQSIERPDLKMKGSRVGLVDHKNAFTVMLQNPLAFKMEQVSVQAIVRRIGEAAPLYQASIKDGKIAPNSTLHLPIFLQGGLFEPGDYEIEVNVAATGGKWAFKEKLTVSKELAEKNNQASVDVDEPKGSKWVIVIGCLVLGLIVIVFLIFWRQSKKNKRVHRPYRK